jgi:hypothetical protein
VIQEAAHEDANIIFGAVVEPNLVGKVKITVIATGFDRKVAARPAPNSASVTPTDLSIYSQHATRTAVEAAATVPAQAKGRSTMSIADSAAAAAAVTAPGSFVLSRRPGVELTLSAPGPNGGSAMGSADDAAVEHSLFDVPAFLRRQN